MSVGTIYCIKVSCALESLYSRLYQNAVFEESQ
nr:MAG TPA: hypothetical protein [Caudoviricetes sp.]